MPAYRIKSEPLGIAVSFDSDHVPTEEDIFGVLKTAVTPQEMLKAYQSGPEGEGLAIKAFQNDFFVEEGGPEFWDILGDVAVSSSKGLVKYPKHEAHTRALKDARQRLTDLDKAVASGAKMEASIMGTEYKEPAPAQYDDRTKSGIEEAAIWMTGLLRTTGWDTDRKEFDEVMKNSLLKGALPEDDLSVQRQVVARALELDESRSRATIYQGAMEGVAGLGMVGSYGEYLTDQAGALLGGRTEDDDARIELDYLTAQFDAMDKMKRGAQLVAQAGGALAFTGKAFGLDVFPDEPDLETYGDIVNRRVTPDPDQALALSLASPDMFVAPFAAAGVKIPFRIATKSAIRKHGMAAMQARAAVRNHSTTVAQLNKLEKLKPFQKRLLANAESKLAQAEATLAESTSKLESLVSQSIPGAHAVAGEEVAKGELRTMIFDAMPKPKAPILSQALGRTLQSAGIPVEYVGRLAEFLHRVPQEELISLLMRNGMEEAAARSAAGFLSSTIRAGAVGTGLAYASDFGQNVPGLGDALALILMSKGGAKMVARAGKDLSLLGRQLTHHQNKMPIFARFGALPDEDTAFTDVLLDRTSALTFGEATRDLTRILSPKRELSASIPSRALATFMSKTGIGPSIEAAGRFGSRMAEGAAIPGGIGFAVGGKEGAAAAIGASFPLISAGAGFGGLLRYNSAGELATRDVANLSYFKKELLPREEYATFASLPKALQHHIATISGEHPDVLFNFDSRVPTHRAVVDGETVININPRDPQSAYITLVAHEVGHHIDGHGLTPEIVEAQLGSYEKGKPGFYTKFEKGKPVVVTDKDGNKSYAYNDEFAGRRREYLDRLDKDPSISDERKRIYHANPELIAREIFAEHVGEDIASGASGKRARRGVGSRLLVGLGRKLVGNNLVRKFAHKIGLASQEDGKIVGHGVFKDLKKIPELQRIIEKYNQEVLGTSKAVRRAGKGRDPVDPLFADEYADVKLDAGDLRNPEAVMRLKAAGVLETDAEGNVKTDATGQPLFIPKKEVEARNKEMANDIIAAIKKKIEAGEELPEGHLRIESTKDGKEIAVGRFLTEDIIDQLAATKRYSTAQIQMLRKMNTSLRDLDGKAFDLFYYAALGWQRGRKVYKSIKGGDRTSLPFGIRVTKDGNVIIETVSYDAFKSNLDWLVNHRSQRVAEAFEGKTATENFKRADNMLPRFLQNHRAGIKNGTPESGVTPAQRDVLNAAIGRVSEVQMRKNPILEGLGDKRSQRNQSFRSRRLDRIGTAKAVEADLPMFPEKIRENLMPRGEEQFMPKGEEQTVPLPFIEDLGGEDAAAGFRRVATDTMRKAEFERFQKGITEKEKWDAIGNQSQLQPFMPRFPKRGEKQYMPTEAWHGTPHTIKPEEGAPLGRFRSSKIGTGEGAQAYGHGLYFAGKKQVAEHYRKELGEPTKIKVNGKPIKEVIDKVVADRDRVGDSHQKRFEELQAKVSPKPYLELSGKEMDALNRLASRDPILSKLDKEIAKIEDIESGLDALMQNESPQDVVRRMENKVDLDNVGGKREYSKEAIKYIEDIDYESAGSLYKVELAPKEKEYLLWDKPLSEQPKGVREKLEGKHDAFNLTKDWKTLRGYQIYGEVVDATLSQPAASAALLEAGIPGIKYLEGASRAKGKGDYNYVIFDEGAVTITEKMFMPAEQAGAPKGKNVEAARLWEKKGVKSPYFKKWFGKSKVVDEKGDPLVVYHGMPSKLKGSFFDPKKTGEGHDVEGPGFYFTNERQEAAGYMRGGKGSVYDVYLKLENPIDANTPMPSRKTLETLIAKAHKSKSIDDMLNKFDANEDLFWDSPLSNWSESPYGAVELQIDAILNYGSAHDAFQTVWYDVFGANNEAYMKAMTEIGIDGVVIKSETRHAGNDHYVAFEPTQIKSATGAKGTFDPSDPRIQYMPAGKAGKGGPKRTGLDVRGGEKLFMPRMDENLPSGNLHKKLKIDPEEKVTVFRVTKKSHPKEPIKVGDWVTLKNQDGFDYQTEWAGKDWRETNHVVEASLPASHLVDMETGWATGQTLRYVGD